MNPRDPNREADWEELLDRELQRLPDLPAPATLIPRVRAALEERSHRPWYRRTWWHWPAGVQILSLALVSVLLGLITWGGVHLSHGDWVAQGGERVWAWLEPLGPFRTLLLSLFNAGALVLKQGGGLVLFLAFALCLTMYLSCVGLGTVFFRVTVRK